MNNQIKFNIHLCKNKKIISQPRIKTALSFPTNILCIITISFLLFLHRKTTLIAVVTRLTSFTIPKATLSFAIIPYVCPDNQVRGCLRQWSSISSEFTSRDPIHCMCLSSFHGVWLRPP